MNSKRAKVNGVTHYLQLGVSLLLIITVTLLVAFLRLTSDNNNTAKHIREIYSSFRPPSSLHLVQTQFVGKSFPTYLNNAVTVQDSYFYTYRPTSSLDIQQEPTNIINALRSSGYNVHSPINAYFVEGRTSQLCIDVTIYAAVEVASVPSARVNNVQINAFMPPCY